LCNPRLCNAAICQRVAWDERRAQLPRDKLAPPGIHFKKSLSPQDTKDRRTPPAMKLSKQSDSVWTTPQDEDLRRQLAAGRSVNEIALRLKRSPLAVRTRMRMLGICEPKVD
jgi:DNA-binding NarL/FixJ family response regulator